MFIHSWWKNRLGNVVKRTGRQMHPETKMRRGKACSFPEHPGDGADLRVMMSRNLQTQTPCCQRGFLRLTRGTPSHQWGQWGGSDGPTVSQHQREGQLWVLGKWRQTVWKEAYGEYDWREDSKSPDTVSPPPHRRKMASCVYSWNGNSEINLGLLMSDLFWRTDAKAWQEPLSKVLALLQRRRGWGLKGKDPRKAFPE